MWFVILMLLLLVTGLAIVVVVERAARTQGATTRRGPHALPSGYMNPQVELWRLAAQTGETFGDIFLKRTSRENQLEQRVLALENEAALRQEAQAILAASAAPGAAFPLPAFKPNEPQTLDEYLGQPHITVPLQKAVAALTPTRFVIDHKLFTGLAGLGKTLLAKVVANTLHRRAIAYGRSGVPFFWSFAANLNKVELLDAFVREILRHAREIPDYAGAVWFIDEIHVLDDELQTKIYALMEDGVYPFEGDTTPTPVPQLMLLGATTDYGTLHPALKRRFGETMLLRRLSRGAIVDLLLGRNFPIQDGAAELLAERTYRSGAPWEALMLRREAEIFARAAARTLITEQDVRDVFDTYDIDELGLRFEDREVIRALFQRPRHRGASNTFVCYGASESDICAVAGLDPTEYRETIKPRLLSRGLLEVRSGYGQALTVAAITHYARFRIDPSG